MKHAYPEWHPEFLYHGHNCYALLQSKYGTAKLGTGGQVPTFDLIDIQLYESWSHAGYALDVAGVPASTYLQKWIKLVLGGWVVDFASDPSVQWPTSRITISPEQFIVGFSFGVGDGKSVYIKPDDVGKAWAALPPTLRPRGVMYWNMQIDGGTANGTYRNVSFAKSFNTFLQTRPLSPSPLPPSPPPPPTPCTNTAAYCGSSAPKATPDCCAGDECALQYYDCGGPPSPPAPYVCRTSPPPPPPACKAVGGKCNADNDCCPDWECGNVHCMGGQCSRLFPPSPPTSGPPRLESVERCTKEGRACGHSDPDAKHCCKGNTCTSPPDCGGPSPPPAAFTCTAVPPPPPPGCKELDEKCQADKDCCPDWECGNILCQGGQCSQNFPPSPPSSTRFT